MQPDKSPLFRDEAPRLTGELWDLGDGDCENKQRGPTAAERHQRCVPPLPRTIIALDPSHPICIHLAAAVNTSRWRPECVCAGSESRTSAERWMTLFLCAAFLSPPVTLPGAPCVCLSSRDRNNKVRPNKRMTWWFPSAPDRQNGEKDPHWIAPAEHHLMGKVRLKSVVVKRITYLNFFFF